MEATIGLSLCTLDGSTTLPLPTRAARRIQLALQVIHGDAVAAADARDEAEPEPLPSPELSSLDGQVVSAPDCAVLSAAIRPWVDEARRASLLVDMLDLDRADGDQMLALMGTFADFCSLASEAGGYTVR